MFVAYLFSLNIYVMDIGSEYIKISEDTVTSGPKVYKNPSGEYMFPSAAVLRNPYKSFKNTDPSTYEEPDLRYGSKSLYTLRKNATFGVKYLPRILGRSENSVFETTDFFSGCELFSLYFSDMFSKLTSKEVSIVTPDYWSQSQVDALREVTDLAGIKVLNFFSESKSMAYSYAYLHVNRFINKTRNVLFLDLGGLSFKSYVCAFSSNGVNETYIYRLAYDYSEHTGSYFFFDRLSSKRDISVKKARKILDKADENFNVSDIQPEIDSIGVTINKTLTRFRDVIKTFPHDNSGDIDEVQVIGGGSSYPFVLSFFKKFTNHSVLLRDFNPFSGLSTAGVHLAKYLDDSLPSMNIRYNFNSSYSKYVVIDKKEEALYCAKNQKCFSRVTLENIKSLNNVDIKYNPNTVPYQVYPSETLYFVHNSSLLNLHSEENENKTRVIITFGSINEITSLTGCNATDCYPLGFDKAKLTACVYRNKSMTERLINRNYANTLKEKEINKALMKLSKIRGKIDKYLNKVGLNTESLPQDLYTNFLKYEGLVEDGKLAEKPLQEINDINIDIEIIGKQLIRRAKEFLKSSDNNETVSKEESHPKRSTSKDGENETTNESEVETTKENPASDEPIKSEEKDGTDKDL